MIDKNKPQTVKALLQWAALFLGKEKRIESEVLLAEISGYSRAKLLAYPEEILPWEKADKFISLIQMREQGEPLQYLTGKQNFMGLDFKITKNVLIPRSDTEVLVEEVIKLANTMNRSVQILDLCTGSGAIAISLAKYISTNKIIATDISQEALEIAKDNAVLNEVQESIDFKKGDLFEPIDTEISFDFIVSNPPYISTEEMQGLPPDVQKEPHLALWGGEDGLDFYRRIVQIAPSYLKPEGFLFLEIGYQQGEAVLNLCRTNGFAQCEIIKDWAGHDRVVKIQWKSETVK